MLHICCGWCFFFSHFMFIKLCYLWLCVDMAKEMGTNVFFQQSDATEVPKDRI